MRKIYNKSSFYERYFMEKDAKKIKKGFNILRGKYKSAMKRKYYYDDFLLKIIETLL